MIDISTITKDLQSRIDFDWFDSVCELLKKDKNLTVLEWTEIIGTEKPNPDNSIRGSTFLIPFDKRFEGSAINPIINATDADKYLDYLSFWGKKFNLRISDIVNRFPNYRIQINIYDGGTQIFLHPIPDSYSFTAISFDTDKDVDEINKTLDLNVHGVTFMFGDKLVKGNDGYSMKR